MTDEYLIFDELFYNNERLFHPPLVLTVRVANFDGPDEVTWTSEPADTLAALPQTLLSIPCVRAYVQGMPDAFDLIANMSLQDKRDEQRPIRWFRRVPVLDFKTRVAAAAADS